jgi:general stress protein YciG
MTTPDDPTPPPTPDADPTPPRRRQGFACLTPERRREVAAQGGRAAQRTGRAHQWTPAEAQAAGRKGGAASRGGRGRLPA